MSDIHIVKDGAKIWNTDTKAHFDKALNKIRQLNDIDAIFVSGDLSDDGSLWAYQYLDESFKSLGIPTYCCPGNHDDISVMINSEIPTFYKKDEYVSIHGWDFYFLNTAVEGMAKGKLSDEKLQFIEGSLNQSLNPVGFIIHHPPIEPEGWLNRKLLENRNDFNLLINKYSKVKFVLFGHIHYHMIQVINNIIYSSASSIGFAFDVKLPKFQIADGTEGFNLISLSNKQVFIENIFI